MFYITAAVGALFLGVFFCTAVFSMENIVVAFVVCSFAICFSFVLAAWCLVLQGAMGTCFYCCCSARNAGVVSVLCFRVLGAQRAPAFVPCVSRGDLSVALPVSFAFISMAIC